MKPVTLQVIPSQLYSETTSSSYQFTCLIGDKMGSCLGQEPRSTGHLHAEIPNRSKSHNFGDRWFSYRILQSGPVCSATFFFFSFPTKNGVVAILFRCLARSLDALTVSSSLPAIHSCSASILSHRIHQRVSYPLY